MARGVFCCRYMCYALLALLDSPLCTFALRACAAQRAQRSCLLHKAACATLS